ncbi:hypothetical protein PERCYII40_5949 [Pseudomonas aeruginosa]|nr:hypothetical protein PERCYII40_5949 [Pseudomonas aeruginosa]
MVWWGHQELSPCSTGQALPLVVLLVFFQLRKRTIHIGLHHYVGQHPSQCLIGLETGFTGGAADTRAVPVQITKNLSHLVNTRGLQRVQHPLVQVVHQFDLGGRVSHRNTRDHQSDRSGHSLEPVHTSLSSQWGLRLRPKAHSINAP